MNHESSITPFVDIHVHPTLKTYLLRRTFTKRHRTTGWWNPLTMRVDLPKIRKGGVNVIVSSIYLPERDLFYDCRYLRYFMRIVRPKLSKRIIDGDPFEETMRMMDHEEQYIRKANEKDAAGIQMANTKFELDEILRRGEIAVLRSIEGSHSLAGKIDNLEVFFERGVCLFTLGHFYETEAVCTTAGIPSKMKKFGCFKNNRDSDCGLKKFGEEVVERMIELGMLIDLTHSTPLARERIYQINSGMGNAKRPLIFSHVGVRTFADHQMNPDDEEIRTIAETGGLIGVIFMNYWLTDNHRVKNGREIILKTIRHIRKVGGIDSIAIGSDFDGFTDPPDDIKDISKMQKLREWLSQDGFADEEVRKITGENFMRVLQEGWLK